MPARARLMPALVAGVLVLFGLLGACAGGSGGNGSSDRTSPPVERLTVKIADGEVSPNASRVEVTDGTPIEITVTSDVADRLHVHGYDKEVAVEPGKPARLEFVADEAGRFEIELHEGDRLVYQLVVLP